MDRRLNDMIKRHEGFSQKPYSCPAGKTTIGWGRNLTDKGITDIEAEIMLTNDIHDAIYDLTDVFPDFDSFPEVKQHALVDMMFNLGKPKFLTFRNMILAIRVRDWQKAAMEAKSSKWYRQVGMRGEEIVNMLEAR